MNLFDKQGHLTDDALHAAIEQTLDEISRLEVSEHLSFCDGCLDRYLTMMSDDTLLTPREPIKAPVLTRIRRRAVAIVFNQYTTYAAAACLAFAFWATQSAALSDALKQPQKIEPQMPRQSIYEKADAAFADINKQLNAFFSRQKDANQNDSAPQNNDAPQIGGNKL